MRKTKDILRLAQEAGLTNRQIARSLNISATTVGECLKRAREAQIGWPLPEGMDDEVLEKALYGETEREPSKPVPEWKDVHRELSRKGVTLMLLWDEYRQEYPFGHYCLDPDHNPCSLAHAHPDPHSPAGCSHPARALLARCGARIDLGGVGYRPIIHRLGGLWAYG